MIKQDISEKQVRSTYLSIGSNIGNKKFNIENVKNLLLKNKIHILDCSNYYETPSWPNRNFPKFLNIILKIKTDFSLVKLFVTIKKIEKKMGRKKSKKNYPRICDIDIIDFKGQSTIVEYKHQKVITPHPRMHTRNFVIFPLHELDKSWIHPKTKVKINNLINLFNHKDFSDIRIV